MEIKTKTFQRKSGRLKGKWAARLEYKDPVTQQLRTPEKLFRLKREAENYLKERKAELEASDGFITLGETMSFSDFADQCQKLFYDTPEFDKDGLKERGAKSHQSAASILSALKDFFGDTAINEINLTSLIRYKAWRMEHGSRRKLKKGKLEGTPLSQASLNRDLTILQKILTFAFEEKLITKNLFSSSTAKKLFNKKAEKSRKRILSLEEEVKLLASCEGTHTVSYTRVRRGKEEEITSVVERNNPLLKAIILLGLDAGLRRDEILRLRWQDLSLDQRLIRIIAPHSKTEEERFVFMTDRCRSALLKVLEFSVGERPFPITDFKRSWATTKRIAKIDGLNFHDLRRTCLTRWQNGGMSQGIAASLAGHSSTQVTHSHYTKPDEEMVMEWGQRFSNPGTTQDPAGEVVDKTDLVN